MIQNIESGLGVPETASFGILIDAIFSSTSFEDKGSFLGLLGRLFDILSNESLFLLDINLYKLIEDSSTSIFVFAGAAHTTALSELLSKSGYTVIHTTSIFSKPIELDEWLSKWREETAQAQAALKQKLYSEKMLLSDFMKTTRGNIDSLALDPIDDKELDYIAQCLAQG